MNPHVHSYILTHIHSEVRVCFGTSCSYILFVLFLYFFIKLGKSAIVTAEATFNFKTIHLMVSVLIATCI